MDGVNDTLTCQNGLSNTNASLLSESDFNNVSNLHHDESISGRMRVVLVAGFDSSNGTTRSLSRLLGIQDSKRHHDMATSTHSRMQIVLVRS